jgi:hypothetical protein
MSNAVEPSPGRTSVKICRNFSVLESCIQLHYYPVNPLSLRERVGERGYNIKITTLFIAPHPGLLPKGEGIPFS